MAVIEATDEEIKVGDTIKIGDDGVEQTVTSLQVDHKSVEVVPVGGEAGMKVIASVKPHDVIYKQA